MAYPIRCVNEILPTRPLARWLLITIRLSMSSLAGIDRTLVAVGTARLAVMLVAVRAAAPRSRTAVGGTAPFGGAAAAEVAAGAAAGVAAGAAAGVALPGAAAGVAAGAAAGVALPGAAAGVAAGVAVSGAAVPAVPFTTAAAPGTGV